MKHFLFKISVLLFMLSHSFHGKAQFVTISDTNFVNWLNNNGYAGCMNGNLMDTTCNTVVNTTGVYLLLAGIYNLDGIQYFDNLNYLNCDFNKLTTLPSLPQNLDSLSCRGNNIAILPVLPASLVYLECGKNMLTSLPALPANLMHLYCNNNQIDSLPNLPVTLLKLNCGINPFISGIQIPPFLTELSCYVNQLTFLPALPATLTYLDCRTNQLGSLPTLPSGLNYLFCDQNQLSLLPNLPASLVELSCDYNQLNFLPTLPVGLRNLECGNNFLYSLPTIPSTLRTLDCNNNQLSSIPPIDTISWINCSYNQLNGQPQINFISGGFLNCSHNLISQIFAVTENLTNINCEYNQITFIDSNLYLNELLCSHNLITSLSAINFASGATFDISDNLLVSLPNEIPPGYLNIFNVSNNPGLTCLPKLSDINNFTWSNTGISCLPNAINIGIASPSVLGLPICQPASGCNFYWNMYGNVFNDLNSNCIINNGEKALKNIPIKLDSGSITQQLFLTNNEGYYSFKTGLGNYEIKVDTSGLPFNIVCPAVNLYNSSLTITDSLDGDLNFGLKCKPGYLDLLSSGIVTSSPLRPGAIVTLYQNAGDATRFYGISCATGISGKVTTILTGPVKFLTAAPGALTPSSIQGDTITWNVADFSLSDPHLDFNFRIQVDTTATSNDLLCVNMEIYTANSEINYSNNVLNQCFSIVNSFDPNAKAAYPEGIADPLTNEIIYTIYFQNTGNATAESIYILDTLDHSLDPSTFRFLSSSHDAVTQLLAGNILRFSYPQINLPDSSNDEPGSHGYVQFKIKKDSSLHANAVITNSANIYFDFNAPILTNEVSTLINFDSLGLKIFNVSDTSICSYEQITAWHVDSFPFPLRYLWLLDNIIIDSSSSVILSSLSAGQHQLTLIINVENLTFSTVKLITVFPDPVKPVINISGDSLFVNNYQNYQWSLNGLPLSGAIQNYLMIQQGGWYGVLISDSNGCMALADTVFACKNSDLILISDSAICSDEGIIAHNITQSPYPLNYTWQLDTAAIGTNSFVILLGLLNGTHQLTLSINGGTCIATETVTIIVFPDPPKPSIMINADTLSSSAASSYQWILNNNIISGAIQNTYIISQSGWYAVLINDSNGCNAKSDSVYVSVVGISEYDHNSFNLYPNPANEKVTISTAGHFTEKEIQILNGFGVVVYDEFFIGTSKTISINNFSSGLYLIRISGNGLSTCMKLMKE